ncbi:MAG: hypothetical protein QXP04_02825 [Candidatus Nanoarchaeia archaeon]|nr:hypothetical protein [Candidatus Jingweiarchaeum tengchongense]
MDWLVFSTISSLISFSLHMLDLILTVFGIVFLGKVESNPFFAQLPLYQFVVIKIFGATMISMLMVTYGYLMKYKKRNRMLDIVPYFVSHFLAIYIMLDVVAHNFRVISR